MPNRIARRSTDAHLHPLEGRRLLSATAALTVGPVVEPSVTLAPAATADAVGTTVVGHTPAQMRAAYGLSGVTFDGGKTAANGAGQTIAIVDAYNDPDIAADLSTFSTEFGLAAPSLTVVSQTGSKAALPTTDAGWAQEISLDAEWVHAIAPAAKLLLVESASASTADLMAGVSYARSVAAVSAISMSWGGSEFAGQTAYDPTFTTPSGHAGITFVAAAGDDGSGGGPEWPASSPGVLSVGGTSLTLTSSGAYSSETGWSDGGGGTSRYEVEPSYQYTAQSTGRRTVPDVAYDADPKTGVAVYDSLPDDGDSGWMEFGGTSAGAPQWAGLVAIANQGRATVGLSVLSGPTNTLTTFYGLYGTGSYADNFNDITTGSTSRRVSAGVGYDEVSGLGTPKAAALIASLMRSTLWAQLTQATTPSATTGKLNAAAIRSAVAVAADEALPTSPVSSASIPLAAPAALATPAVFDTGGLDATAAALPAAAFPTVAGPVFCDGPAAGTPQGWADPFAPAAAVVAPADWMPAGVKADVAPVLSAFSLNLLADATVAPVAAVAGPSFAATLAASTRALHPFAAATAVGVAAAAWFATEPARDRRRAVAAKTPFADRLISLVPPRG